MAFDQATSNLFEEFDRSFVSQAASTRAGRDLRHDLGSKKFSQLALEAYFGRCPALRLQPAQVLNANLMLNLWMPDNNRNHRVAVAYVDPIVPIVFTKHSQTLGHCFVE